MTEIFRVDRFRVPPAARDEFWRNVRRTHAVLRDQPGFVDDALLESGTDVVTIVRWASADALPGARAAAQAAHEARGFDPVSFFATAGIEADLGTYTAV
ncbi:antibiotic biosynthesis monooxygenase [Pseudonocardia sp. RS11V-5]|uniref:antibiotic biosynthesis monooxygenase family protein n=1 Tax=Pseudonocardia terrae TaxID=2905831 RepID=UPI001E47F66E|nr:antibiotic biosynthesis monooxygenase [Pseudonocardia terrae]MCE3555717.1 antibiotic biosynthesis monooxygenase [Pseudonocardia terrae]